MRSVIVLIFCSVCYYSFAQPHEYKVVNTFHIRSSGWWDYVAVNDGKVYVSHGNQVNILDAETGDSVGYIPNTTGVHGIAFDNAKGRGYTSNGRSNTVTVFDLKTNGIITVIPTVGKNPDAIMYEPHTKTIITCNGGTKNLSIIDPATNKVVKLIDVGGKPETAVSDGAGKLFVNIEDKNEILAINLKTHQVEHHWSLEGGEGPSGLAYDPVTKKLFAGCEKQLVVMDAASGKVVKKLPIGEGCDGVVFDAKNKLVISSNGEGTITVIEEKNSNDFSVLGNYPTRQGARTIAINEANGTLYLPTAEFEPNTPKGQWPKMIPGTFQVLEVK